MEVVPARPEDLRLQPSHPQYFGPGGSDSAICRNNENWILFQNSGVACRAALERCCEAEAEDVAGKLILLIDEETHDN